MKKKYSLVNRTVVNIKYFRTAWLTLPTNNKYLKPSTLVCAAFHIFLIQTLYANTLAERLEIDCCKKSS